METRTLPPCVRNLIQARARSMPAGLAGKVAVSMSCSVAVSNTV